jgi:predicted TIM-barrel fold metal-dependent hydrolase
MIIDSHAHLKHGDAQGTEYSARQIIQAMDEAGIARSVVFAMSTSAQRAIDMAEEAVRRNPDRLIPYAYGLPAYDQPVLTLLESAIRNQGFRGIKLHTAECSVASHVAGPLFDLAAALAVPCLIDFGGRLVVCEQTLDEHPATTVIIAHLGKYLSTDGNLIERFIEVAHAHDNALLDASGVAVPRLIERAVSQVGHERVLFGTDGPHSRADGPPYKASSIGEFARNAVAQIQQLNLTDRDKDALLGGNLASLLRLEH